MALEDPLYAVRDCLAAACLHRKQALILDFFAGSGTTLNAVNLLNAADGGNRRCILVTNNEVSDAEVAALMDKGLSPGDADWERNRICQSITFPRCKYTIPGKRDDGTPVPGEYLTGRTVTKEKPRNVKQLGFVEGKLLTLQQRKQLVALVDSIPQSKIMAEQAFFVDANSTASILFDATEADAYLAALEEQEHITDFYIITQDNRLFNWIKQEIQELLGPELIKEEEKRPLSQGFPANLEYFKLDFLDPNEVVMGRQFEAILPILRMMAGAKVNGRSQTAGLPILSLLTVLLLCCSKKSASRSSGRKSKDATI